MTDFYNNIPEFITDIQRNILNQLKKRDMNRSNLVSYLNTPRTTIYDNLLKLQKLGLVTKYVQNSQKVGRPIVIWMLTKLGHRLLKNFY